MNPNRLQLKLSIALAMIVLVVFGRTIDGDFLLWDDPVNVTNNELIKSLDGENLGRIFGDFETAARYKPLAWLGWAIIYQVYELDPAGYHMANVALHMANAVLIYLLLIALAQRMIDKDADASRWKEIHRLAAVGSLVWAIHPLRAEHVSWVTGFPYGLALLPTLWATLLYLRLSPDRSAFAQPAFWGAVGLYLISVLTYPIVLGFPAALIAMAFFPLKRFHRESGFSFGDPRARAVWLEKLPFFLVAGAVVGLTLYGIKHSSADWFSEWQSAKFTWPARIMQAFYMEAVFLWKSVLPFNLAPVYLDLFEIKGNEPRLLVGPIVVIAVSIYAFRSVATRPAIPALWFAWLGLMVPFLGLTTYPHYPSDRYSIMAGLVVAFGVFGVLLQRKESTQQLTPAIVIVLLLMAVGSFQQAGTWQKNNVFFTRLAEMLPNGPHRADAYYHLGGTEQRAGRINEAIAHFEKAWATCPDDPPTQLAYDYGVCLLTLNRPQEALKQFNEALRWQGETTAILGNIGYALMQTGQHQQAAGIFQRLTQSAPDDHLAWVNLGVALAGMGDGPNAIRALHQARDLAPQAAVVYHHLSQIHRGLGQLAKATEAEQKLKEITAE